jgi:sugar lactone lactonase YvrE
MKLPAWVLAAGALAVSIFIYRTLESGRGDAHPVFLENLNPHGEMIGPEGICFDLQGNLYISDTQGIVWSLPPGGQPREFARLDGILKSGGNQVSGPIRAGGMAFDGQGNLYIAAPGLAGGAIVRVDAGTKAMRIFARGLGVAAGVVTTRDGKYLWASDSRAQGRLLRLPVSDAPSAPDIEVPGLEYPLGIALGKDEKCLYAAESFSGDIVRVDLAEGPPQVSHILNLKGAFARGSLDGIVFDPRDSDRRFLYLAENLRGMVSVIDLQARPPRIVKRLQASLMGGRPCPAFLTIRDGYLYFTDLWSCNLFRILLGIPKWHTHAYRFRVTDLASLY